MRKKLSQNIIRLLLLIVSSQCYGQFDFHNDKGIITIANEKIKICMPYKKNYSITGFYENRNPGINLLKLINLKISSKNEKYPLSEFFGGNWKIKTTYKFSKSENSAVLDVHEDWPQIKLIKKIFIYKGQKFCKIIYNIEVTKDFDSKKILLRIGGLPNFTQCCYDNNGNILFYKNTLKNKWFGIPRNDTVRWISFYDEKKSKTISIIGASATSWAELPARILANARKDGSFAVELTKAVKKQLRIGDKIQFDIFIYVSDGKNIVENNNQILKTICP